MSPKGIDSVRFRSQLVSETVTQILGGALKDSTVLDLGSHSGLFTFDMAQRGARHVTGVEVRDHNVRQAEFLKQHYGIENTTFILGDALTYVPDKKFDVILQLGLLYHVTQPVELIRFCHDHCTKLAVIDTICHKEPFSAYLVFPDKDVESSLEGTKTVEFHPTYRAIIDTMLDAGFKHIIEVTGESESEIDLYDKQIRRCLIGIKDESLLNGLDLIDPE